MTSNDFKTDYREDMVIFPTLWTKVWMGILILVLVLFPLAADRYLVSIVNSMAIACIGALGLNILIGYTGLVSIGHGAFLAIGAYSTAFLSNNYGLPFLVVLPLSGALAALGGLLISIPALRLKGIYVAMATLAFNFIIVFIFSHLNVTGGANGTGVPGASIGAFMIDTEVKFYLLVMVILSIALLCARNIFRTRIGRSFIAIRDRDLAARLIGINISGYKILSFVISSFYAGVGGSLFACYYNFIVPENFNVAVSIQYIAIIVLGGLGSLVGTIFGAILITLIPEGIRMITDLFRFSHPGLVEKFSDFNLGISGLIIVSFLIFEPEGLYGIWKNVKAYFKTWPFRY